MILKIRNSIEGGEADVDSIKYKIAGVEEQIALLEKSVGPTPIIKALKDALNIVIFATARKKVFSVWANDAFNEIKAEVGSILDEKALGIAEFAYTHTMVNAFDAIVEREIASGEKYGEGVVSVEAYIEDDRFVIDLRDNGAGIPQKAISHLFYFEIDSHKDSAHYFGQYGTALYEIAKRIGSLPGARLEVASRRGPTAPIFEKVFKSHKDENIYKESRPLEERIYPPKPESTFWTRIKIIIPTATRTKAYKKVPVSKPQWSLHKDGNEALAPFGMHSSNRPTLNSGWTNLLDERSSLEDAAPQDKAAPNDSTSSDTGLDSSSFSGDIAVSRMIELGWSQDEILKEIHRVLDSGRAKPEDLIRQLEDFAAHKPEYAEIAQAVVRAIADKPGEAFKTKPGSHREEEIKFLTTSETINYLESGPIHIRLAPGTDAEVKLGVYRYEDFPPGFTKIGLRGREGYYIIDENIENLTETTGFKALRDGETVVIGREIPGRFNLNKSISRRHIQIKREGDNITITDLGSVNGTEIKREFKDANEVRLAKLEREEKAINKVKERVEKLGGINFFKNPIDVVAEKLGARELILSSDKESVVASTPPFVNISKESYESLERERKRIEIEGPWRAPEEFDVPDWTDPIAGPGIYYNKASIARLENRLACKVDSALLYHEMLEAAFREESALDEFRSLPVSHANLRVVEETLKFARGISEDSFENSIIIHEDQMRSIIKAAKGSHYPEEIIRKFEERYTEILNRAKTEMSQHRVSKDKITLTILPEGRIVYAKMGEKLLDILEKNHFSLNTDCGKKGICGKCGVFLLNDGKSTNIKSCQTYITTDIQILVPFANRVGEAKILGLDDYKFLSYIERPNPLVAGIKFGSDYALAVDIGTTTVVASLIKLKESSDKNDIYTASSLNWQGEHGGDVITRITYADSEGGLKELQNLIISTINNLLSTLTEKAGIDKDNIRYAVFSGNTVMTHLVLGLSPHSIGQGPDYAMVKASSEPVEAKTLALEINPMAQIFFTPCVHGFLGGDVISDLLIARLKESEELSLMIDLGTNGEMVLGNKDRLLATSCAMGPAFEGLGISSGIRAQEGAIEAVAIDRDTFNPQLRIIGNGKPLGICGTGLVDAISQMYKYGIINNLGRINKDIDNPRIRPSRQSGYEYVLWEDKDEAIVVTEKDIETVLKAKAAVYAATRMLLREYGKDIKDVKRIYIAGGFGRYLDILEAVNIGLLPALFDDKGRLVEDRYIYIGNGALKGAILLALDKKNLAYAQELAEEGIRYIDLQTDKNRPIFQDAWIDALTIPIAKQGPVATPKTEPSPSTGFSIHKSYEHTEFYNWLKSEIDAGRMEKGLPLLLFDFHHDADRVEKLNIATWVYFAQKEGLIGDVYWIVPEWDRPKDRSEKEIAKAKIDLAKECRFKLVTYGPEKLPQKFEKPVLVTVDFDYFSLNDKENIQYYRPTLIETREEVNKMLGYFRDNNIQIRAVDLTETGRLLVFDEHIDFLSKVLPEEFEKLRDEDNNTGSISQGDISEMPARTEGVNQLIALPGNEDLTKLHDDFVTSGAVTKLKKPGFNVLLSKNLFRPEDVGPLTVELSKFGVEILPPEQIRNRLGNQHTENGKFGCIVTKDDLTTYWNGDSHKNNKKAVILALDIKEDPESRDKDYAYVYIEGLLDLITAMADKGDGRVERIRRCVDRLFDKDALDNNLLEEYLKDNDSMKFALSAKLKLKPLEKLDANRFNDYKKNAEKLLKSA